MHTSILIGLALSVGAPAAKDKAAKPASIEGEWAIVDRIIGGKRDAVDRVTDRIAISADRWTLTGSGPPKIWELTLDRTADPPHITLNEVRGQGNGPPAGLIGIYRLSADQLTICYVLEGKRPTTFESPAGSDVRLLTLRRVKPKD